MCVCRPVQSRINTIEMNHLLFCSTDCYNRSDFDGIETTFGWLVTIMVCPFPARPNYNNEFVFFVCYSYSYSLGEIYVFYYCECCSDI